MKKTFLIAGLVAGLTATNGYADIVISQTEESPDITISVVRAGKIGSRVVPKTVNITDPIKEKPEIMDKVSSGWTWLVCQEGCKPRCVETAAGGVYCDCRNGDGGLCEDAISTSGPDNSLR